MKKRIFSIILVLTLVCSLPLSVLATNNNTDEIIILHTNDTHCAIEDNLGFAGVAAYKSDMEDIYGEDYVTLVDAGDAVQGGPIGTLTEGEALIEIMNAVGYDYMAPGNHEYDYGMTQFFDLMSLANAKILSCNFIDLTDNTAPFAGYAIEEYNGTKVAYVGITTPETLTSSDPTNFQDANGNYIYSFSQDTTGDALYTAVQTAVDAALDAGADYVIAIGHLGVDAGIWSSTSVIQNTTDIDVFIDGHSHTIIDDESVTNKNGETVILNQTGSKLLNLGKITINTSTKTITAELISGDEDDPDAYTKKDTTVQAKIDEINAEFEDILNEVVAYTSVDLLANDPTTGEELVRSQETNLGDLVADAYRTLLDADIAIANGGGIRDNIDSGDITYEDIINVHPYGNEILSVALTGQQVLDALEFGASAAPDHNSGFLQVSGLTYTIDTTIESSVQVDANGNFVSVDGEYRVTNVMVGDEPLDLEKTYSVASHNYYLQSYGDGFTMFKDAAVVKDNGIVDNEVLINYIVDYLDGEVGSDYENLNGQGRITLLTESSSAGGSTDDTTTDNDSSDDTTEVVPETSDNNTVILLLLTLSASTLGIGYTFTRKKAL